MKKLAENPHRIVLIPELPPRGGRLGRHIDFDERSRAYGVVVKKTTPLVTKLWKRTSAALDQKDIGACTGFGAAGLLTTVPYDKPRQTITGALARKIYSKATSFDSIQGEWPPSDTGSTILAAMQALVALKLIKEYRWCFGISEVLQTLSNIGPVEVGVNWYDGFDHPDVYGKVSVSGYIRGGHAFEILGLDVEKKTVTAINSWGASYGNRGRFVIGWDDLDRLLHEDGEAATIVI